MTTKIGVLGLATIDLVFEVDTIPTAPEKFRAQNASMIGGGGGANAATAIARLGSEAHLLSRLGSDFIGEIIVDGLVAEGVDVTQINRRSNAQSAFSSIYVDAAGERQIVNFRGRDLEPSTEWLLALPAVNAVLTDNRWPAGAARILALAAERGIPGVVDAEAPIDLACLTQASHVAFSRQGLRDFAGDDHLKSALVRAGETLRTWVGVTDGSNGAWYMDPDGIHHVPAPQVSVVDTLGAGDVWHGAFTVRLAEGADAAEAVRFANVAAALKCRQRGARFGMPTRTETEQYLQKWKS